jgi:hypothetical protein
VWLLGQVNVPSACLFSFYFIYLYFPLAKKKNPPKLDLCFVGVSFFINNNSLCFFKKITIFYLFYKIIVRLFVIYFILFYFQLGVILTFYYVH